MDDDAGIQHAAFHYRFTHGASGTEALAEFLDQRAAPALRQAAAACVVRFGSEEQQHCLTQSAVDDLLDHDEHSLRAALAQVLAKSQHPDAHQALIQLAHDENERVRRVAAQSMGATQNPDFVPTLLRMLADDDVHVAVWDALAGFGPAILDALVEAFENEATDERVRRRIPRVVSSIPDQRAADVLMPRLQCADPVLRYNVSAALLRLRSQQSHITVDNDAVDDALGREVAVYYQLAQALHRFCASFNPSSQHADMVPADDAPVPSTRFDKLINERLDRSAQRIFQLLGLRYSEPTMRRAYEAIDSDRGQLRALAVEWLDNVLDPQRRRQLRPIVDPPSMKAVAEAGRRLVGVDVNELDEALALLITGPDAKMQASALGMIPHVATPELLRLAEKATTDPDPRVRVAAEWVLEHTNRVAATA
jgi:HEAT repeat protein